MSDPVRRKKMSVFIDATVSIQDRVETLKLNSLVDKERFLSMTEEQQKSALMVDLKNVSPTPVSGIYKLGTSFKYVDSDFLKDFDYGNVLAELHIPYCIDIPNDYEIEVLFSKETGEKALIIPTKIWTKKAQTDTEVSNPTDFFAEDKVLYFQKYVIVGPKIPLDSTEGWEHNYTGFNVQRMKDRNGRFRFTRLYVQFDLSVKKEELEEESARTLIEEKVKEICFKIVNNLIDTYRFVTKQEHLTRLGEVTLNMVYFIDLNEGLVFSPVNTEAAVMNRSKKEIEEMERMLETGETPDLYNLLLLDAQNSFNIRNYPLAVMQSFQSLEIFVENFLIEQLKKNKGLSEKDAIDYLDKNWRTKDRLKDVLKEAIGFTIAEKDKGLWDKWLKSYDLVRNEIIHKGKEPVASEVKDVLENNIKIISILKTV